MTVTVDIPPDMETRVRQAAEAEGVDVPTFMREATASLLRQYDPARSLSEADLLARINRGFPEAFWNRHRQLIAKRRAETMTHEEQQEAIGMSDQLEAWNVERLQYLIKLAEIRHTSVDALVQEMGLHPAPIE